MICCQNLLCKALRSSCFRDGCRKKNTVQGPLGANISASQAYGDFQRLRHSDLMLKFIYYSIHTFCLQLLIAATSEVYFDFCSAEAGWGGEDTFTSGEGPRSQFPSTNFCPQISVYGQLPATFATSRYSFIASAARA